VNRTKTLALLASLTALLLWIGHSLAGAGGLAAALALAVIMNFGTYWFSDRIVLRMYGAREVSEADAPGLHEVVRGLSARAGLPTPRVFVIPEEAPNAFATGRSPERSAVAVTQGLLRILSPEEVAGVLAHEIGHIRNRDTLIMTVAATIAGALSTIANMAMWGAVLGGGRNSEEGEEGTSPLAGLAGLIVAPFAAMLIQTAISRTREFLADEAGARLTGNPLALARALHKLEGWSRRVPMDAGNPATAHMFIVNPFAGGGLLRLFSTHPPTADRVARLEEMHLRGFPAAA
jgi:heat shock protein HtpX